MISMKTAFERKLDTASRAIVASFQHRESATSACDELRAEHIGREPLLLESLADLDIDAGELPGPPNRQALINRGLALGAVVGATVGLVWYGLFPFEQQTLLLSVIVGVATGIMLGGSIGAFVGLSFGNNEFVPFIRHLREQRPVVVLPIDTGDESLALDSLQRHHVLKTAIIEK